MKKHSDSSGSRETIRQEISGLSERSFWKNYYPELQERLSELEESQAPLRLLLASTDEGIYRAELHELLEQREDLIRTVSHDLCNPLAIIMGRSSG